MSRFVTRFAQDDVFQRRLSTGLRMSSISCAHGVFGAAGFQFHLGHSGNGGQGLAPETHGADAEKIFNAADLGGGVAFKTKAGIGFTHAATVVYYLHQFFAGVFEDQLYFGGPGIDGVFQQFFHGGGRSLDHFTSRDLVGNIVG